MKTLLTNMESIKTSLYESLLDDLDDLDKSFDLKIVKDWIKNNYKQTTLLKISDNPNKDGKYEVSANHVIIDNKSLTSLTNDMFVWKKVGSFNCWGCASLISLKGAPKEVGGNFDCYYCDSLTSLEGAPEKVGGNFDCSNCDSLTSLEGAPKEIGKNFYCDYCDSLTSLEGAPKVVGRDFNCSQCNTLISYELPKNTKIRGEFIK